MKKARVILYSKPLCHLCEEMKAELRRADCDSLYTVEEVNIESAASLLQRYQLEIPVLNVNGVDAFKHRVTAAEFRKYLMTIT